MKTTESDRKWQKPAIRRLMWRAFGAGMLAIVVAAVVAWLFHRDARRALEDALWVVWLITLVMALPSAYVSGVRDARKHSNTPDAPKT